MPVKTLTTPTQELVEQAIEAGSVALWAHGLEDGNAADEISRAVIEAALPVLLGRAPSHGRRGKTPKRKVDLNELFWECGHLREAEDADICSRCKP